jgi:hypothetical protein
MTMNMVNKIAAGTMQKHKKAIRLGFFLTKNQLLMVKEAAATMSPPPGG